MTVTRQLNLSAPEDLVKAHFAQLLVAFQAELMDEQFVRESSFHLNTSTETSFARDIEVELPQLASDVARGSVVVKYKSGVGEYSVTITPEDIAAARADTLLQFKGMVEALSRELPIMFEHGKLNDQLSQRWLAVARTHFQEGLMAMRRSYEGDPNGF